jgi:Tfp pilus assembly protein PilF
MLAKCKWLGHETSAALKEIKECLEKDPTMVEAHIFAALINSENGNNKAAEQNL